MIDAKEAKIFSHKMVQTLLQQKHNFSPSQGFVCSFFLEIILFENIFLCTFLWTSFNTIIEHQFLSAQMFFKFSTFSFQVLILKHGLKQKYKMGLSLSSWFILHCWVSYVLFIIPMKLATFKPIT